MFKIRLVVCPLLLICAATCRSEETAPVTKSNTNPAFEKLKSLAGTWVEVDAEGKPTEKVFSVVRVTAVAQPFMRPFFQAETWKWFRSITWTTTIC